MIDVVIPTLNSQKNIQRCLNSIVKEIPEARLIVVDGGSRDTTVYLAKKLGAAILNQDRPGLGEARRIGLVAVKSPIMAMVDSDVILPNNWFCQMNEAIKGDENIAVASGWVIFGDPGCKPLARLYEWRRTRHQATPSLSNVLLRTRLIRQIGGFNPEYQTSEDVELRKRILAAGLRWEMVDEVVVRHQRTFVEELAHNWWQSSRNPLFKQMGLGRAARFFFHTFSYSLILSPVDLNLIWMQPLRCFVRLMGYIKQLVTRSRV